MREKHRLCTDTGMLVKAFSLTRSPSFLSSFMLPLSESSCKQSIAHANTHCCYAQETINYASLLTRPVTRQMNRKTKLARALATEKLPQTRTHTRSFTPSRSHLFLPAHIQSLIFPAHTVVNWTAVMLGFNYKQVLPRCLTNNAVNFV